MSQLTESARMLWARLAVFAGSCSIEAIQAIQGTDHGTADEIQAHLKHLVDQGFLQEHGEGQQTRYQLPSEHRAEAHSALIKHGEEEQAYERAIGFFVQLAGQALDESFGPQRTVWIARLEQEHDNLAGILDWCVSQGHAERGLELAILLMELWFEDTHTGEGRDWFAKLLDLPLAAARTAKRATALDLAGALAVNLEDYTLARQYKEEGLSILRELGEPVPIGFALIHLAHLTGFAQGNYSAARALYQEALDLLREANHIEGTAHALGNLGTIDILLEDEMPARQHVKESLQLYQRLDSAYDLALSLRRTAGIAMSVAQPERAIHLAAAGHAQMNAIGVSLPAFLDAPLERLLDGTRSMLSKETQTRLWKEGQAMSLEQAVAEAMETLN